MGDSITWAFAVYCVGCTLAFLSYAVRDMLLLRIFAIGNCTLIVPYYIFNAKNEVLWAPILMALVVAIINIFNTLVLLRDSRPPRLTPEEAELYQKVFHRMSARAMLKILKGAQLKHAKTDEVLIHEGEYRSEVVLLRTGSAKVFVQDNLVAQLVAGRFVGEMAYIRDQKVSSAQVVLAEASSYLVWQFDVLDRLKVDDFATYSQLFATLSVELAQKVQDSSADEQAQLLKSSSMPVDSLGKLSSKR